MGLPSNKQHLEQQRGTEEVTHAKERRTRASSQAGTAFNGHSPWEDPALLAKPAINSQITVHPHICLSVHLTGQSQGY